MFQVKLRAQTELFDYLNDLFILLLEILRGINKIFVRAEPIGTFLQTEAFALLQKRYGSTFFRLNLKQHLVCLVYHPDFR